MAYIYEIISKEDREKYNLDTLKEGLFKSLVKTNIAITVVIVVATFIVLYILIFKLGSVI